MYMACYLCNNSKNRFYNRKIGFTTKLSLSNGKTGFTNKTFIIKLKIQFISAKPVLPFDNDNFFRKTGFTVQNAVLIVLIVENTVLHLKIRV